MAKKRKKNNKIIRREKVRNGQCMYRRGEACLILLSKEKRIHDEAETTGF